MDAARSVRSCLDALWRRNYRSIPALVLGWSLILGHHNGAASQIRSAEAANPDRNGVRHVITVSLAAAPNSHFYQDPSNQTIRAMLTVTVRISDHAQETQFYGDVKSVVPEFNLLKGSVPNEVWRDAKCHHERGLPKITLINVEGSIRNGTDQIPISARFRWLGRLMPGDEVTVGRTVSTGVDETGPFRLMRAETKESRILIDLKLYLLPCELPEG